VSSAVQEGDFFLHLRRLLPSRWFEASPGGSKVDSVDVRDPSAERLKELYFDGRRAPPELDMAEQVGGFRAGLEQRFQYSLGKPDWGSVFGLNQATSDFRLFFTLM
jgi:hypothetical protein